MKAAQTANHGEGLQVKSVDQSPLEKVFALCTRDMDVIESVSEPSSSSQRTEG